VFLSDEFSFDSLAFVDKENDILIFSLECLKRKKLPQALVLNADNEDIHNVLYITGDPKCTLERTGSPGVVLKKNRKPAVTVMHLGSRHHFHSFVPFDHTFTTLNGSGCNKDIKMTFLLKLLKDHGQGALKGNIFDEMYENTGYDIKFQASSKY